MRFAGANRRERLRWLAGSLPPTGLAAHCGLGHTSQTVLSHAYSGSARVFCPDDLFAVRPPSADLVGFSSFLDRARAEREQGNELGSRTALGAYLVARLFDRRLRLSSEPDEVEGFNWQLQSTQRFLRELPSDQPEAAHLLGIVESVCIEERHRATIMRMAALAFAYYLEHEGRLEEALDMLGLAAHTYGSGIPVGELPTLALFIGRIHRALAHWDAAGRAYGMAEQAGQRCGELNEVMLARIGQANVLRGRGNLSSAQAALKRIIQDCDSKPLLEVQGRAWFDLSVVLAVQGDIFGDLVAKYEALKRLRDPIQRSRVLGDLGIALRAVGAYDAARHCFEMVLRGDAGFLIRANVYLELMDLESAVGNRVAYERFRQEARLVENRMPPSMAIDYRYKMGVGLARFGREQRARSVMREALTLAETHGLNEWYFRIDRVLRGLEPCPDSWHTRNETAEAVQAPAVVQISEGIRELAQVGV